MNLRAEVTIDLDEKRRVWSQADAEDVPLARVSEIARELSQAAAQGAEQGYLQAVQRREGLGGTLTPTDVKNMRGFQEGD